MIPTSEWFILPNENFSSACRPQQSGSSLGELASLTLAARTNDLGNGRVKNFNRTSSLLAINGPCEVVHSKKDQEEEVDLCSLLVSTGIFCSYIKQWFGRFVTSERRFVMMVVKDNLNVVRGIVLLIGRGNVLIDWPHGFGTSNFQLVVILMPFRLILLYEVPLKRDSKLRDR